MKKVFKTEEVAHIWARQTQSEGRNSANNVYFSGKQIFSYGNHFCMAKLIDLNTVIVTNRKYSNTTAKHLRLVAYAINHFENKIFVPYPAGNLRDQAKFYINEISSLLNDLNNTRKKQSTRDIAAGQLRSIVDNIKRYCLATNQKLSTRWIDTDLQKEFNIYFTAAEFCQATNEVVAKVEKLHKARNRAADKARKARLIECQASVSDWIAGCNKYVTGSRMREIEAVYLRAINYPATDANNIEINVVETSKGAIVSLKSAKVLFDMIRAGRDIKGHDIDGYTVVSINGCLQIGCHKIELAEIERFAKSQNW